MNKESDNPEDRSNQLELLTQTNRLLENVKELTPVYGSEKVIEFMQLGGLFQTTPNSESIDANLVDIKSQKSNSLDLMGKVESLGLELNPKLINLITTSTFAQVKIAIAKYKTYQKVDNPEGLFWRILTNERE